jgi:hypothetical protein
VGEVLKVEDDDDRTTLVRHDDGIKAPYGADELRPEPEAS